MQDLLTALALVFVIEGVVYSLFPATMRRLVTQMAAVPDPVLRLTGLAAVGLGVAAVWVIRQAGWP